MPRIDVGDSVPDLVLPTQGGDCIRLTDFRERSAVVVFFFPKDGSPICTREACAFRDSYEDFVDAGVVVIGVSADSADQHQTFASHHRLPYLLASDEDGEARRAFGVPRSMGLLPGRVTYVIDRQGIVRHVFSSQFAAERHVKEALDAIRTLDA